MNRLHRVNTAMQGFNYHQLSRIRRRIPRSLLQGFDDVVQVLEENFKDRWDIRITTNLQPVIKQHQNVYGYYYGYEHQFMRETHWEQDWISYVTRRKRILKSNGFISPLIISGYIMPPLEATKLEIKILYPKLTIRNSKGMSRELLNMVVVLGLESCSDKWLIQEFSGARLTLTMGEYLAGYVHSHLPRIAIFENEKALKSYRFCTGNGHITVSQLEYGSHNSLENFEAFVLMIQPYLEWESLEGGPYIYMDNTLLTKKIDPDTLSINAYASAHALFQLIWDLISSRFREPNPHFMSLLEWQLTSRGYKIVPTERLLEYYKSKIRSTGYVVIGEGNTLYEYKDSMGEFNTSVASINLRAPSFRWRGEVIRVKIIDDMPDGFRNVPQEKIIVHPLIVKYVNSKLEAIFNNKITDEIILRKISENRDTQRDHTQNQVSMQGNIQR